MVSQQLLAASPARLTFSPLLVIALPSFLVQFDLTAVLAALPGMGAELGGAPSQDAWIMDSYGVALAASLLAAGLLADRLGRRLILLVGLAGFAVASLICAMADALAILLIGRIAQGAASALVICASLALIAVRFSERSARINAFGIIGSISGVAMATGPILGGWIAEAFGWRMIFAVNLPICALLAAALPLHYAESSDPAARPIDWGGVGAVIILLTAIVYLLLEWPRAQLGENAAVASAFVLLPALYLGLRRAPANGLAVDLELLQLRGFRAASMIAVALSMSYWSALVYLPLYLDQNLGFGYSISGLMFAAATMPMLALPPVGGWLAQRIRPRRLFMSGLASVAIGNLLLAFGAREVGASLLGMLLMGCGAALTHSQISGLALSFAPVERSGVAASQLMFMRQGGFALGVAVLAAAKQAIGAGPADYLPIFLAAALFAALGAIAAATMLPAKN